MIVLAMHRNHALMSVAVLLAACSDRATDGGASFECAEVAPGGGTSKDGPPTLTAASMIDRSTVRLVFSEAMAPVGDVDPTAFRLSLAAAYVGDLPGTMYSDLASYAGDSPCPASPTGEQCCYSECTGDDCVDKCVPGNLPLRVAGVCNDSDDPEVLLLHLDRAVDERTCFSVMYFEYYNEHYGPMAGGGIFVHYTDDKIPVTDAQSEPLAPIAEHWALDPDVVYSYADGSFPMLDPWLPIACPS